MIVAALARPLGVGARLHDLAMRVRHVGRFIADLGSISNTQARELLERHARLLDRYEDDERAVASVAVLEAAITGTDPVRCARRAVALEKRRMRPLPQWRIRDAPAEPVDPDEYRLRRAFRRELAFLPPRQGIVLEALLCGETLEEIGRRVGISRNIAHRAAGRGLAAVVAALG